MKQIVRLTTMVTRSRDLVIEVPDDAVTETEGGGWRIKVPPTSGDEAQRQGGGVWVGVQTALDKGLVKLVEVL